MKNDILWRNSQCVGIWLHDYQIVGAGPDGVVEMCMRCKDRQYFKMGYGNLSNIEYLDYHLRQALLKQHPLFSHEYPNK